MTSLADAYADAHLNLKPFDKDVDTATAKLKKAAKNWEKIARITANVTADTKQATSEIKAAAKDWEQLAETVAKVTADTREASAEIAAAQERWEANTVNLDVDADLAAATAEVEAFKELWEADTINLNVDADTATAIDDIDSVFTAFSDETVYIDVEATGTAEFIAEVQSVKDTLDRLRINIKVEAETGPLAEEVEAVTSALDLETLDVLVTADTAPAYFEVQLLMEWIEKQTASVNVGADTGRAKAQAAATMTELGALRAEASLKVDADTSPAIREALIAKSAIDRLRASITIDTDRSGLAEAKNVIKGVQKDRISSLDSGGAQGLSGLLRYLIGADAAAESLTQALAGIGGWVEELDLDPDADRTTLRRSLGDSFDINLDDLDPGPSALFGRLSDALEEANVEYRRSLDSQARENSRAVQDLLDDSLSVGSERIGRPASFQFLSDDDKAAFDKQLADREERFQDYQTRLAAINADEAERLEQITDIRDRITDITGEDGPLAKRKLSPILDTEDLVKTRAEVDRLNLDLEELRKTRDKLDTDSDAGRIAFLDSEIEKIERTIERTKELGATRTQNIENYQSQLAGLQKEREKIATDIATIGKTDRGIGDSKSNLDSLRQQAAQQKAYYTQQKRQLADLEVRRNAALQRGATAEAERHQAAIEGINIEIDRTKEKARVTLDGIDAETSRLRQLNAERDGILGGVGDPDLRLRAIDEEIEGLQRLIAQTGRLDAARGKNDSNAKKYVAREKGRRGLLAKILALPETQLVKSANLYETLKRKSKELSTSTSKDLGKFRESWKLASAAPDGSKITRFFDNFRGLKTAERDAKRLEKATAKALSPDVDPGLFRRLGTRLKDGLLKTLNGLKAQVKSKLDFDTILRPAIGLLKQRLSNIGDTISSGFSKAFNGLKAKATEGFDKVVVSARLFGEQLKKPLAKVGEITKSAMAKATGFISRAWDRVPQRIRSPLAKLLISVQGTFFKIGNAARNLGPQLGGLARVAVGRFTAAFRSSRFFRPISRAFSAVGRLVTRFGSFLTDRLSRARAFVSKWNPFSALARGVGGAIKVVVGLVQTGMDAIKSAVAVAGDAIEGVSDTAQSVSEVSGNAAEGASEVAASVAAQAVNLPQLLITIATAFTLIGAAAAIAAPLVAALYAAVSALVALIAGVVGLAAGFLTLSIAAGAAAGGLVALGIFLNKGLFEGYKKQLDVFKNEVAALTKDLATGFAETFFQPALDAAYRLVQVVVPLARDFVDPIAQAVIDWVNQLSFAFASVPDVFGSLGAGLASTIDLFTKYLTPFMSVVEQLTGPGFEAINATIQTLLDVGLALADPAESFFSLITTMMQTITPVLIEFNDLLVGAFEKIESYFTDGRVAAYFEGLPEIFGQLAGLLTDLFDGVLSAFDEGETKQFVKNLAVGIDAFGKGVEFAGRVMGELFVFLSDVVEGVIVLKTVFQPVIDIVTYLIGLVDSLVKKIQSIPVIGGLFGSKGSGLLGGIVNLGAAAAGPLGIVASGLAGIGRASNDAEEDVTALAEQFNEDFGDIDFFDTDVVDKVNDIARSFDDLEAQDVFKYLNDFGEDGLNRLTTALGNGKLSTEQFIQAILTGEEPAQALAAALRDVGDAAEEAEVGPARFGDAIRDTVKYIDETVESLNSVDGFQIKLSDFIEFDEDTNDLTQSLTASVDDYIEAIDNEILKINTLVGLSQFGLAGIANNLSTADANTFPGLVADLTSMTQEELINLNDVLTQAPEEVANALDEAYPILAETGVEYELDPRFEVTNQPPSAEDIATFKRALTEHAADVARQTGGALDFTEVNDELQRQFEEELALRFPDLDPEAPTENEAKGVDAATSIAEGMVAGFESNSVDVVGAAESYVGNVVQATTIAAGAAYTPLQMLGLTLAQQLAVGYEAAASSFGETGAASANALIAGVFLGLIAGASALVSTGSLFAGYIAQGIIDTASDVGRVASQVVQAAVTSVARTTVGVTAYTRAWGETLGLTFGTGITLSSNLVETAAAQLVARVVAQVQKSVANLTGSLRSSGISLGVALMNGFNAGLSNGAISVYRRAAAIASEVAQIISNGLEVKSPSKVTERIGKDVAEGLAIGLENVDTVVAAANVLAKAAVPELSLAPQEIGLTSDPALTRQTVSGAVQGQPSGGGDTIYHTHNYNINTPIAADEALAKKIAKYVERNLT